jgi:hypothetical protein
MTLFNQGGIGLSNPDPEMLPETQEDYPDEVLESEWNPILEEIHSLIPNRPEPSKPRPTLVDAAKLRRFY